MGKDLKGKEIGAGVYQRKDKKYSARFVSKVTGKRVERYFDKPNEAKNWLAEAKYEDEHNKRGVSSQMTVDAWFNFWIDNIVGDLAPNTRRNYRERYKQNIQPVIGKLLLSNVKPLHCQKVLNDMNEDYAGATIRQTFIAMGTMLKSALMNDLITKHPMDGVRFIKPVKAVNDIRYLTIYDTHLYKLCDEAGIKRFCLHTLRHTFATRMVESNVNFKYLSSILGHASIKTTLDRYAHTTNDSMLQAVQQFETKMKEVMAQKWSESH